MPSRPTCIMPLTVILGAALGCGRHSDPPLRWEQLGGGIGFSIALDRASLTEAPSSHRVAWVRFRLPPDSVRGDSGSSLRDSLAARFDRLRERGNDRETALTATLVQLAGAHINSPPLLPPATDTTRVRTIDIQMDVGCAERLAHLIAWRFSSKLGLPSELSSATTPILLPVAPETAADVILNRLCSVR